MASSRIGNADEALYQEAIHPATTVPALSDDDRRGLYDAIQIVLDAAIAADSAPTALDPERFMLPHRYGDKQCPATGAPLDTQQVSLGAHGVLLSHPPISFRIVDARIRGEEALILRT
jgi:hypothetical protein